MRREGVVCFAGQDTSRRLRSVMFGNAWHLSRNCCTRVPTACTSIDPPLLLDDVVRVKHLCMDVKLAKSRKVAEQGGAAQREFRRILFRSGTSSKRNQCGRVPSSRITQERQLLDQRYDRDSSPLCQRGCSSKHG